MKTFFDTNIRCTEDVARYVAGALLLGWVMYEQFAPVWLALVAIYPILTAIIAWDPVYAAIRLVKTVVGSPNGFDGKLTMK